MYAEMPDHDSLSEPIGLIADDPEDSKPDNGTPTLRRTLTLIDGVSLIVGIIIGSGIFSSPGTALAAAGSPAVFLLCWAASGALVLFASTTYAELGATIPCAGGDAEDC